MLRPTQCRAARGLLAWSQHDLALRAGVGIVTVRQLEAGANQPRRATLDVIRRAFENAGVEFIDENGGGPGVRLRQRSHEKSRKRTRGWCPTGRSPFRRNDDRLGVRSALDWRLWVCAPANHRGAPPRLWLALQPHDRGRIIPGALLISDAYLLQGNLTIILIFICMSD